MSNPRPQKLFDSACPLNEGNLVFVDTVFGSDSTGKLNQRYQSFKTIGKHLDFITTVTPLLLGAAVAAIKYVSGFYTIVVHPGVYCETLNLLTTACYYFEPGAIVQNMSQTPLFGDIPTGTGVNAIITGSATFISKSKILTTRNGVLL
jgi:hypothetical protein